VRLGKDLAFRTSQKSVESVVALSSRIALAICYGRSGSTG
jgi:hypothetical protein